MAYLTALKPLWIGIRIVMGYPIYRDLDSDGDTILDSDEPKGDQDGDGIPDYREVDSDNDGINDNLDLDYDNDTILDEVEKAADETDVDNDGIPNYRDSDSDGDGKLDIIELTSDDDMDGIENYLDSNDNGSDGFMDNGDGTQTLTSKKSTGKRRW